MGNNILIRRMFPCRRQWESYVSALAGLGCRVTRLPPLERFPDCVFVEDTAVIVLGANTTHRAFNQSAFW